MHHVDDKHSFEIMQRPTAVTNGIIYDATSPI